MNYRWTLEGGLEPVYLCRCGETHIGPYALYDYSHHMCFHDAPLWDTGDGQVICADCGKPWVVEGQG